MLAFILNELSATVFLNGKSTTVSNSHRKWAEIKEALKTNDEAALEPLLVDKRELVAKHVRGRITFDGNTIYYDGTPLQNAIVDRIVQMAEEGFAIEHMLTFLDNLLKNVSFRSISQLYTFLEKCNLPITADGQFIAYKRINADWTDCHTGRIHNYIGSVVEVSRQTVDDDPNNTCSYGLHVCSLEYLTSFHGARLILVKVNPKDVVAIPTDYNHAKMRVCRYEVLEELDMSTIASFNEALPSVYGVEADEDTTEGPYWDVEDEDDGYID